MSSFTMTLWSLESILLVMNVRTAWTAASAPPFTETPSWIGNNSCNTARETAKHVADRYRLDAAVFLLQSGEIK